MRETKYRRKAIWWIFIIGLVGMLVCAYAPRGREQRSPVLWSIDGEKEKENNMELIQRYPLDFLGKYKITAMEDKIICEYKSLNYEYINEFSYS